MQRGRLRQSGDKRRPRCTPSADWSEAAVACRTGGCNARTLEGGERGDGTGLASKGLSRLGRDSTGPIGPPLVVKVDFSSASNPSAAACEIVEPEFSAGVALGARSGAAHRLPSTAARAWLLGRAAAWPIGSHRPQRGRGSRGACRRAACVNVSPHVVDDQDF